MGINPISKKIKERKGRKAMLKALYNKQHKRAVVSGIISAVFLFLGLGISYATKENASILEKIIAFTSAGVFGISGIVGIDSLFESRETKRQLDEEFPGHEL